MKIIFVGKNSLLFTLLILSSSISFAQKSFNQSKNILKKYIYGRKGQTFYCDCPYQKNSIKLKKCDIQTKKYKKRMKRLEWEHIVPIAAFGHAFKAYREARTVCHRKGKKSLSPRKCAMSKDKVFKEMSANLHNLVPVVGSVNAIRSHYSFDEIGPNANQLCAKGFKVSTNKVFPPEEKKGDIARIYLYMNSKYPGLGIIGTKRARLFKKWHEVDPPSKEECRIHDLKVRFQKDSNPFLASACKNLLQK